MEELLLGDLIDNVTILQDIEIIERYEREHTDRCEKKALAGTKTRVYAKPIPEHLKGYAIPEDINSFVNDIYANMNVYILSKTKDAFIVDDIIGNFMVYILGTDQLGRTRYRKYDNVAFPDQPYWKWFFVQLDYFFLSHRTAALKAALTVSLSESSYEETVEKPLNNAVNIDLVSKDLYHDNTDTNIFIDQTLSILKRLKEQYEGAFCFEYHAFDLFVSRLKGESNNDFATRMKISPSAASQWMRKLRVLVTSLRDCGCEMETV